MQLNAWFRTVAAIPIADMDIRVANIRDALP